MDLATPFNMLILGMTGCGKMFHLNLQEGQYKKHFDYIYLVCPTFPFNKTYQNWAYVSDPDLIVIDCDHKDVDHYLRLITCVAQGPIPLLF